MLHSFIRFCNNEDGATAIEYGLIIGLISAAIIGGASAISGNINTAFQFIADALADF